MYITYMYLQQKQAVISGIIIHYHNQRVIHCNHEAQPIVYTQNTYFLTHRTHSTAGHSPMYGLVPVTEVIDSPGRTIQATLKSVKWAWPSESSNTLAGLTSRWIIFFPLRYSKARASSATYNLTRGTWKRPSFSKWKLRSPPMKSDIQVYHNCWALHNIFGGVHESKKIQERANTLANLLHAQVT